MRFPREARFETEKDSVVKTIQRIATIIDRINVRPSMGEAVPAEFHDQYPRLAQPVERPLIVGYSVWPR